MGRKTIVELSAFINKNHPEIKGFNRVGLYRMKQFYETYSLAAFVTPLVTQTQVVDSEYSTIVSPLMRQLKGKKKQVPAGETILGKIDIRKSILVRVRGI